VSTAGKAIFLSYASQDAEAARRICDALRSAGLDVWFDRSELRGGDAWDASIRKQIKDCALFVPIISANTQAREEGYFRREWNLAADRTLDMADGKPFLLPVVIDATLDVTILVPEKFREVQWTQLVAGEPLAAFTELVQRLLAGGAAPAAAVASMRNATPAADEPAPRSIVVGPFRAPQGDGELHSFAGTLARDLSRLLADTMRDVHVMPVDTGQDQGDVTLRGHRRRARYRVEGEIRASGDDVVIITQFVDAVLSRQMGSDRRTVPRALLEAEQERATLRLMYVLRHHFENAERRRCIGPLPPNATAQELVNRARMIQDVRNGEDLEGLREARSLYDRAIVRDPSLVAAWADRVGVHFNEFIIDYKADRARLLAEMDHDSARAVELDAQDPAAWHARHLALQFTSRFDAAFAASDRAQALDPVHYFFYRGFLLIFAGRAAEALALIEARNSMLAHTDLGLDTLTCDAHLQLGDYRQSILCGERAAAALDTYWNYLNLTAAYAHVGEMAKAAAARAEFMRRVPEFTIARFWGKQWSVHPTWVHQTEQHLVAGLRKAGVPE
jgi:TolB-like protein/tetratricopeptide (TPR) repeat protein